MRDSSHAGQTVSQRGSFFVSRGILQGSQRLFNLLWRLSTRYLYSVVTPQMYWSCPSVLSSQLRRFVIGKRSLTFSPTLRAGEACWICTACTRYPGSATWKNCGACYLWRHCSTRILLIWRWPSSWNRIDTVIQRRSPCICAMQLTPLVLEIENNLLLIIRH